MPATVTFGTVAVATPLVVVLGALLTCCLLAGYSFASRGLVYDLAMPRPKPRRRSSRTALDSRRWP